MTTFASLAFENKKKKTRREKFLEEMDQGIPWERLLKIARKRYPKKGNQWYFGMKAHVGTDTKKGLVHSVVVTNAAVHDSRVMDDLLHEEERTVYRDKAYSDTGKCREFESRGTEWHIDRKGSPNRSLTQEDKDLNHEQHRTRAKVEHAFLLVKHLWGYRKVRYNGPYKNAAQLFSLFVLANLYLVRRDLLLLRG